MKRVLFFSIFLVAFLKMKGQNVPYCPMAVEGAHWFYEEQEAGVPFVHARFSLTIKGDTMYKNTIYKKIYEQSFYFDNIKKNFPFPYQLTGTFFKGLIREDTLSKKIFYIGKTFSGDCPDNTSDEFLLYDFSKLVVGDTVKDCMFNNIYPVIVKNKTKALFAGKERNTIIYHNGSNLDKKIIEGIGFIPDGGLFHIFPFENPTWFSAYCLGTDDECFIKTTKSKDISLHQEKLIIRVNHSQYAVIPYKLYNDIGNFSLLISDINGRKIKAISISDISEMAMIELYFSGLYIATLLQNNIPIGVTKVSVNF